MVIDIKINDNKKQEIKWVLVKLGKKAIQSNAICDPDFLNSLTSLEAQLMLPLSITWSSSTTALGTSKTSQVYICLISFCFRSLWKQRKAYKLQTTLSEWIPFEHVHNGIAIKISLSIQCKLTCTCVLPHTELALFNSFLGEFEQKWRNKSSTFQQATQGSSKTSRKIHEIRCKSSIHFLPRQIADQICSLGWR